MMNPVQGNAPGAIDHQERRLRKLTNPKQSVKNKNMDIARAAARGAATSAVTKILGPGEIISGYRGRSVSDLSRDDDRSIISHELAMERGSTRGFFERNERGIPHDEHALTSITEEVTTLDSKATKEKKKDSLWKKINPLRIKRKQMGSIVRKMSGDLLSTRTKEISREAWMCGCCGKVFSSYEIADAHEERCVFDRIEKLGYRQDLSASLSCASVISDAEHDELDEDSKVSFEPEPTDLGVSGISQFASARLSLSDFDVKPTVEFAMEAMEASNSRPKTKSSERPRSILRQSASPLHPDSKKEHMAMENDNESLKRFDSGRFSDPGCPLSPTTMHAVNETLEIKREKPKPLMRRKRTTIRTSPSSDALMISNSMREFIVMTDEALINGVERATMHMLTKEELDAEKALRCLSSDKAYYDMMGERHQLRNVTAERFRSEGQGILSKVQNKFVDAYQLIKEGDQNAGPKDEYNRKGKGNGGMQDITHDDNTLYVNVMVKHSVTVVNNELQRMARQRWADVNQLSEEQRGKFNKFEHFRAMAHGNLIKLAGMALASDFTPRKVAVQLSNELYRLMVPQLKRRGVTIETDIEYRVGQYFILAVNVKDINWQKLIKFTNRDVQRRRYDWRQEQARREELRADALGSSDDEKMEPGFVVSPNIFVQFLNISRVIWKFTATEMVALFLSSMYYVHWSISIPLCTICYKLLLRTAMRRYVLSTVTDEIFSYVEEKGMEMEIGVKEARYQASFMLAALREMREDSRVAKQKRQEVESSDKGNILGPLLGPNIKTDKGPAPPPPDGFELPDNLEFVGLEIDLPVGFRRLRWAFMHKDSLFVKDAVFRTESKYDNITFGDWNKHNDIIGAAALPPDITEKDVVGAEKETSYLMPKSAFVGANMAAETNIITAYNDYCFCIKKRCLTPDVPYGSTFVAWTQLVFTNTGNNTAHLVCSVEAEFPNGPPMVGRQIKSGMRSGVGDLFVLMGETIVKYSDEFPT